MTPRSAWRAGWAVAVLALAVPLHGIAQQPAAAAPASAASDPRQRVVVTVNGEPLTAADVDGILETLPIQSREYYKQQGRYLLPQYLVRMKVLALEARKQKLDEQPDIRKTIENVTESILADAARRRLAQDISVPEDEVGQFYESKKRENEEVRIRRLLIRTESSILSQGSVPSRPPLPSPDARKKLEELRKQILEGASFVELARDHSDDLDTAGSGGDMGFVTYQTAIPPILQAANALQPGQVSEIIPTPYGLEIIQVVEKRFKPLEQVRPEIESMMRQGKLEEKLQELQGQYQISVDNEYFAPSDAGVPGAPAGR